MNWDDFRYFLTVIRTPSIRAAADTLGVNHATVSRRIEALEKEFGLRLFDRSHKGLLLSPSGEAIRPLAEDIEAKVIAISQRLRGMDDNLSGVINVSVSDGMLAPLTPIFYRFHEINPDIQLHVTTNNYNVGFNFEDAHLALRCAESLPEHLVGRLIGSVPSAAYCAQSYLEKMGESDDLSIYHWIGWVEQWRWLPSEQWLKKNVREDRVVYRVNSSYAMREAVASGLGVAHLLCMEADSNSDLTRLGPKVEDGSTKLWMVTHPELRKSKRIQMLMEFLANEVRKCYLETS